MGILNGPAVPNQPTPNLLGGTFETKKYEARMIQQASHRSAKRAKPKAVVGAQLGWTRTMFGWCAIVSLAEDNRGKMSHCIRLERPSASEANFDRGSSSAMDAEEAGRQRGCVVCNHNVSYAQQIGKI